MPFKITITLIKSDVDGFPGHSSVHPGLIKMTESALEEAKKSGALIGFMMRSCGDDREILMSYNKAVTMEKFFLRPGRHSRKRLRKPIRSSSRPFGGLPFQAKFAGMDYIR